MNRILTTAVISCLSFSQYAIADEPTYVGFNSPRGFAVVEVGPALLNMKETQFFIQRGENSPFAKEAVLDTGSSWSQGGYIGGEFGHSFDLNKWGFDQYTVSLAADWTRTETDSSSSFYDTGAGVRFGWVTLDNSNGYGTNNGNTLTTMTDRQFDYGGATVLISGTKKLGDRLDLTLGAGPSFRRLLEKNKYHGEIGGGSQVDHNENLTTNYLGGAVKASVSGNLTHDLKGSVSGQIGIYRADSSFNAQQTISSNHYSETRSRSLMSYSSDVKGTLSYALDEYWTLSGFGRLTYLSNVPTVNYGSSPQDTANGKLRLEEDSLLGINVGLSLAARF